MTRWAPDDERGRHPYVETRYPMPHGRAVERIVYGRTLAQVRRGKGADAIEPGVRRATVEDVERVLRLEALPGL